MELAADISYTDKMGKITSVILIFLPTATSANFFHIFAMATTPILCHNVYMKAPDGG